MPLSSPHMSRHFLVPAGPHCTLRRKGLRPEARLLHSEDEVGCCYPQGSEEDA